MAPSYANDFDQDEDDARVKDEQLMQEKLINEEYKIWKKNTPFLYDLILSTALDWPTLTTQWLPDKTSHEDKNYSVHRLLLGTHTSGETENYVQIADVHLPNPVSDNDPRNYDEEKEEIGGYGGGDETQFRITQKIIHEGEVNKARYSPKKPDMIATMSPSATIFVFDRTKHSNIPSPGQFKPDIRLIGHTKEGFGLNWHPTREGHLLSGSEDATVRLWDLNAYSKATATLESTRVYNIHGSSVNDVQHHHMHDSLFGSVSDDLTLQIVDTRNNDSSRASFKVVAHSDAVNSLAFNPKSEFILATGSSDQTIALWDLRNLASKLHVLEGHTNEVLNLEWHPHEASILASSSQDRRIIFWDLARLGEELPADDQDDGPPELLFMHGGHTNRISDLSWNQNDPWVIASAAEDNLLQCWRVAEEIVGRDDADIPLAEIEG